MVVVARASTDYVRAACWQRLLVLQEELRRATEPSALELELDECMTYLLAGTSEVSELEIRDHIVGGTREVARDDLDELLVADAVHSLVVLAQQQLEQQIYVAPAIEHTAEARHARYLLARCTLVQ